MTRKHFEWAAAYVRNLRPVYPKEAESCAQAFSVLFTQFNPNFNAAQFHAACMGRDFTTVSNPYTDKSKARTRHYSK